METLGRAFGDALQLLWSMDADLFEIVGLTLQVTLIALAIALVLGIPIGAAIGLTKHLPDQTVLEEYMRSNQYSLREDPILEKSRAEARARRRISRKRAA